ncbi:hypothetical protein ABT354_36865 [Streptomyces sp. NPDC000594]|uniref:hypothetical protein n=1 Tax=Streptomyces sp. NPDC000594 TaxID=3154261 RepID=UPI003325FADB
MVAKISVAMALGMTGGKRAHAVQANRSPFGVGRPASSRSYGGRGCFYRYGDRIWVKDESVDGRRTVVEYRFNYDRPGGECHAAGGAGTVNECNENMWEQGKISFRVVIRNGSEPPNAHESGWSPWLNIG